MRSRGRRAVISQGTRDREQLFHMSALELLAIYSRVIAVSHHGDAADGFKLPVLHSINEGTVTAGAGRGDADTLGRTHWRAIYAAGAANGGSSSCTKKGG
jgi:hypothetical protein